MLEDVEAPVEEDFPASVGDYVASVERASFVELPGETNPDRCA